MNIEVNIPSNLSELTLSQYNRYLKVIQDNNDVGENSDRFIKLKMLEIFCNIPYKVAMEMTVVSLNNIVGKLTDLMNKEPELVLHFQLGDTEFGFIPSLKDMTFGEYIDLDDSLGDWKNMHKAMSVLYRPIKKKVGDFYSVKEYKGDVYHDIMHNTPLDAVFGSMVFFYRLGIDLSKLMKNYLQEDPIQEEQVQKVLEKSGVGINQFTHSLKGMLDELNISQN